MRKNGMWIGLVAIVGLFALSGLAFADGSGFSNTMELTAKMKEIGAFLLGVVFFGFLVVGGYIIVTSLVDAKRQGGWGHFVVGVFMVLIAGIALWTITSMANQDPNQISQEIRVQGR